MIILTVPAGIYYLIDLIIVLFGIFYIFCYPEYQCEKDRKKFVNECKPGDLYKHDIFGYIIRIVEVREYTVVYDLENAISRNNVATIKSIINNYSKV